MNDEQILLVDEGSEDDVQESTPTGMTLEAFNDPTTDATFVLPHPPQDV